MDSLWTLRNITSLDGSRYEAIDSSISQNIFSEKILQLKITKKRMAIANFINIYIYIHTNIYADSICDKNDSK